MKLKHYTKGPWRVDNEVSEDGPCIAGPDDVCFAFIHGKTYEHEANANLIATAPEMLDLLEQISRLIDRDSTGGQTYDSYVYASGIQAKIDAVILKARGES